MRVADHPDDTLTAKNQCRLQLELCMSQVLIVGLRYQVPVCLAMVVLPCGF